MIRRPSSPATITASSAGGRVSRFRVRAVRHANTSRCASQVVPRPAARASAYSPLLLRGTYRRSAEPGRCAMRTPVVP